METDRKNVETNRKNVETNRKNVETDRKNVEFNRKNVETDRNYDFIKSGNGQKKCGNEQKIWMWKRTENVRKHEILMDSPF